MQNDDVVNDGYDGVANVVMCPTRERIKRNSKLTTGPPNRISALFGIRVGTYTHIPQPPTPIPHPLPHSSTHTHSI